MGSDSVFQREGRAGRSPSPCWEGPCGYKGCAGDSPEQCWPRDVMTAVESEGRGHPLLSLTSRRSIRAGGTRLLLLRREGTSALISFPLCCTVTAEPDTDNWKGQKAYAGFWFESARIYHVRECLGGSSDRGCGSVWRRLFTSRPTRKQRERPD